MAEKPEDLNLPNTVITRIIKDTLPDGVNVSKDAKLAMSKAASIFVLYATSCANTLAMHHKRKTISGADVLEAMGEMEFDKFVEPLKLTLQAYKKEQSGKKEAAEKKKQEQNVSKDTEQNGVDAEPAVQSVPESAAVTNDAEVVEEQQDS